MTSFGVVVSPIKNITFGVDWWSVNRTGTIQTLAASTILANYRLFPNAFVGDATTNTITAIDARPINAGETETAGIEYSARGETDLWNGKLVGDVNVSQLLEKQSRLIANAPFGNSEVGRFTRASDIGLKWKHTASIGYRRGNWSFLVNNLYRNSYTDAVLPGVVAGLVRPPDWQARVKPYSIYGLSATYRGIKNTTIIAGVKNLFNEDPPFSATYDTNTGAGSSWEPRIADPRGRSFTLRVDYRFF
jgi:iron complex outermembrane receptor protein